MSISDIRAKVNHKKTGAVMVVGGGIAGMQAALDLANSGFKVYLVEENTAIGGRMSQLDKTFPTNDCSTCMISPRLIDVDKNRNIELITNAKVLSLDGQPGNFTARVLKKPRYIDLKKCTNCGDCARVCPVDLINEFEHGLSQRKAAYKRYPQAIPGAWAITKAARPPCKIACPAGCNAQGYVALISKGKYLESRDLIMQTIPFPSTLGRICHHPCEAVCNRAQVEEAIAIRPLKAFAGDIVRQKRQKGEIPPEAKPAIDPNKPRVAVVGAGPSGLTCAYDLVKKGYPVTVFEAGPRPGGQLQLTIPRYRLPQDVLQDEIKDLIDLGIDLKLNSPIDNSQQSLAGLKMQGYHAVYLAIGAQKSQGLQMPGNELKGVLGAIEFLKDINADKPVTVGKRVVVVGGGNVAMDAARSAVRLGAKEVTIVYRRSEAEMPARLEEIEEAIEEGVKFRFLSNPKQVLGDSRGRVTGMEYNEMELGEPDETGRRRPIPKATTSKMDCDTVIIAIGQATDLAVVPQDSQIKSSQAGLIEADPVTLATGEPGIFAGGDVVTGPKSAVEAIAQGHEAAISIERYLAGADLSAGRDKKKTEPAPMPEGKYKRVARVKMNVLPIEKRVATFDPIEPGYSEEEARAEAERCLDCGLCSECMQCVAACQAKAIDHSQKEEVMDLAVGAVVMAPGFEPFDARLKGEYGYGRMPNVVTSLEFERILSASGPFQGQVRRPSDGKHPVKIGWIQCVGSRDETCGREYCSSVCCMYATKEAIIAREHDSHIQPAIFYNDIRAFGKNFERYYESAKSRFGVKYIKGIPASIKELQQSHNLILEYNENGKKVMDEYDMVVLSIGLVPSRNAVELAGKIGIATDKYGFCATRELNPNITSRPGVFVAGAFDAPMDIPESVMSASAAAALAGGLVAEARGTMITERTYPPELQFNDQEPRIGVFVCRCGTNIARVVDVPGVTEYAKTLPYVVYAEENLYTCSTDTQNKMIATIKEKNLNRVVVASCSPRTHEPLFQDTVRDAGMNRYLFEMANIRDQCSWVHATRLPEATDKAKDLVRMAVARAATLEPLHQQRSDVKRRALVIGGGLAGMTASLALAAQGFESALVEREKELGGNLKHLFYTGDGSDPQALLASLVKQVEAESRIKVYQNAEVKSTSGYLGNYKTVVETADGKKSEVEHGVVILSTGGVEYKPTEYLYGKSDKVLTQAELETEIAGKEIDLSNVKTVVMIQCVGSREPEHQFCSRVCCSHAVKNALKIKELNPAADIYVLYRDIRTYGMHELQYRLSRDKGVGYIQYEYEKKPAVSQEDGKLRVKVFDSVLGTEIVLEPDLLVLSSGTRPQPDAEEFASRLKLPLNQDKFYMEAQPKLRPLDFVNDGMYLCGLAHSPKFASETIVQASGAVSRALTVLSQPYLMVGGIIAQVSPDRCVACLTCVRACPFRVPKINREGVAYIEPAACQGCGICASACPRKAIKLQHYADEQIEAKTAVLNKV